MSKLPLRIVKGEACVCAGDGYPKMDCAAELWHDAVCENWRHKEGGKQFDTLPCPTKRD